MRFSLNSAASSRAAIFLSEIGPDARGGRRQQARP